MQVPPWHMRRHGPVFVPDRKVLTPQFVLQAGCCWSSTEQHNPWEGGLECGHSRQGVFGQHTALVACAPVPAAGGPSSPGPCEWQWAAQVTVEGSSGRCGGQLRSLWPPRSTGSKPQGSRDRRHRQRPAWTGASLWLDERKDKRLHKGKSCTRRVKTLLCVAGLKTSRKDQKV